MTSAIYVTRVSVMPPPVCVILRRAAGVSRRPVSKDARRRCSSRMGRWCSAAEREASLGGLATFVWAPEGSAGTAPAPLVVFSHGFHGCATQSRFLMQALAADGYLVVAPNHRD